MLGLRKVSCECYDVGLDLTVNLEVVAVTIYVVHVEIAVAVPSVMTMI